MTLFVRLKDSNEALMNSIQASCETRLANGKENVPTPQNRSAIFSVPLG
ncbi:hypothetical protein KM917_15075 [Virgibacillus pantothenticus]|nr:hypothetical protein [Virgibacillus pantothenticus]MBU8673997.1 hypothetical protein [Virgibacillus pantothenticus]